MRSRKITKTICSNPYPYYLSLQNTLPPHIRLQQIQKYNELEYKDQSSQY